MRFRVWVVCAAVFWVLFAGAAFAPFRAPAENNADKKLQEKLIETRRQEYNIFKFKQGKNKNKKNKIVQQKKKAQALRQRVVAKLTREPGSSFTEQILNLMAAVVIVTGAGWLVWRLFLRDKYARKNNQKNVK